MADLELKRVSEPQRAKIKRTNAGECIGVHNQEIHLCSREITRRRRGSVNAGIGPQGKRTPSACYVAWWRRNLLKGIEGRHDRDGLI